MGPSYPLKNIKKLIREGKIRINTNATQKAWDDFGWRSDEIKKCLLKLNDRYHNSDPVKNHFYKTDTHRFLPGTKMDYYKANNILRGINLYTHFYIHPDDGYLVISSFKEL